MKNETLVSVIIPVYNAEAYMDTCLSNLQSQSYKNIEVILVDDGSTDNTQLIAKKYPVKIISQENKGVSAARNRGLEASRGSFIHFLDADDLINNDFYKALINAATETGADVACSGMINQKSEHKTILFNKQEVYTTTYKKLEATYVGKWGYVWRYLFKKSFIDRHQLLFEEGRIIEDLMFAFPAVYFTEKLVVVPDAVYTYVYRENSQMTDKDANQQIIRHQDWLHAKKLRDDFAKKHKFKIPGVNTRLLRYLWWKFNNTRG